MSELDLPEPRRRRVAPAVPDPMAPTGPQQALPRPADPQPIAAVQPAPPVTRPATPAAPAGAGREATVQLGTRVSPKTDTQLRELAAHRGTRIRNTIEDLVADAWAREVGGGS